MNIIEIIAQDVFDKVRGRFANLQMGNEDGTVTSNPKEARFFDFDFVLEGNNLGRVSLSINERGSLKVFYSQGITEGQDGITRGLWYEFLKEMRYFAKRRMLRFDTRDITKGNLDKSDFQYLAINGSKEDNMNESSMYGSSKTSYRKLENTRLIVRHGKAVDEGKAGDRSRHINALFVENSEGERFKYPFIHLAGAKCMQRHVANGGTPHDDAGKAIIKMSEQIAQLNSFKRHVKTATLNDDAHQIHERAGQKLQNLRDCMNTLQTQRGYQEWAENFSPMEEAAELDPVTMEDYKAKFTVKHFDETLAGVFPLIHSIMQEAGTVDLDSVVHEGDDKECDECGMLESKCKCDDKEKTESFEAFESWADAIVEGTMTPDQIDQLKDLLAAGLTLGPDGTSAIEALQNVGIEDEKLEDALKSLANVDPSADPIETLQAWLRVNDPDALSQLDIGGEAPQTNVDPVPQGDVGQEPAPQGDMGAEQDPNAMAPEAGAEQDPNAMAEDEEPAIAEDEDENYKRVIHFTRQYMAHHHIHALASEDVDAIATHLRLPMAEVIDYLYDIGVAPEEDPAMAEAKDEEAMDNAEPRKEKPVNIKELAEFIGAFYNPNAREQGLGEWRKGPTELGIMAGKQFGDRAGRMVELMVTKMQERTQGHQEFAEVMKLAGIKTQEATQMVTGKSKYVDKKVGQWTSKGYKVEKTHNHPNGDKTVKLSTDDKKSNEGIDIMLRLAGLAK
jgi:hypothetical protein